MALLGVGGMGEVYPGAGYEARAQGRAQAVARAVSRLRQNGCAASSERRGRHRPLNHPNILTIYEIGETDGRYYIATEFVEGRTLRRHMESARIAFTEVLKSLFN